MTDEKEIISNSEPIRSGKKKWKWIAGVMIVSLLAIGAFFLFPTKEGAESEFIIGANVREGTLDNNNEGGDASNGRAAMSISLNGFPVFENGESEGNLNIVNPANNVLYMTVEITLDETGEVIYESGGIPPGHLIDNDKLNTVLDKGEHNATAQVTIVDPDNLSAEFNSANFDLLITVQN